MPPKNSRPIKLDGIEDPKVPRQIAEELAKRNDVLEVVYFPPAQQKSRASTELDSSPVMSLTFFYFILLHNSRVRYQFIFHNQNYFQV